MNSTNPRGRKLTQDEIRDRELVLLDSLKGLCNRHQLHYFVHYGTLLGAVRHKDFIPWDDDIDVLMPREDYDKLLDLTIEHPSFSIFERGIDLHPWLFAKLVDKSTLFIEKDVQHGDDYGVFIDIFPLDMLPKQAPRLYYRFVHALNRVYDHAYAYRAESLHGKKRVIRAAGRLISQRYFAKLIEYLTTRFNKSDSDKLINYHASYTYERESLNAKDCIGSSSVTIREQRYDALPDPEDRLAQLYGSQWRIPLRDAEHIHGEAYWRDEPSHPQETGEYQG